MGCEKRLFDIILSISALVVLSPVVLIIAALIKLDSEGPIIYKQKRVGEGGSIFTLYKFRTMIKDAEKNYPVWPKNGDPRITKLGRFLRRTNLDEIPQFYNVIKGDMSLVGPRPERAYFVDKFASQFEDYRKRFLVKPGITGWAQVNGLYGDTSIAERLKYDLHYVKNQSMRLDLKILSLTAKLLKTNITRLTRYNYG